MALRLFITGGTFDPSSTRVVTRDTAHMRSSIDESTYFGILRV